MAWQAAVALEPSTPGEGRAHRRLAALYALTGDREAAARHVAAVPETNWPLTAAPQRARNAETGPGPPINLTGLPARVTIGPAVRIDVGGGTSHAAEVSLAATTGGVLVAAWNDLREAGATGEWRLGWASSDDGGLTWNDDLLRPPGALPNDFEGDPMTAFDPRTGTLWVGGTQFFGDELYLARRTLPSSTTSWTLGSTFTIASAPTSGPAGPRPA